MLLRVLIKNGLRVLKSICSEVWVSINFVPEGQQSKMLIDQSNLKFIVDYKVYSRP